jgi:hypothetical protein
LLVAEELRLDIYKIEATLKNDLTHHDFNIGYLEQRTIEDSKIQYKKDNLDRAHKNLQEYEETFNKHMPKMANLSSMKSIAKDAIDQNYFYNRDMFPRSKLEEERLVNKIKDMEKHTGMDMSPLLDSKDKEVERIKRHKKAFETYKSYAFLKSGLKPTNLEKKLTSDETSSVEQYKFPSADKIAKVFINDDYKYEMLKQPEEHYKPGRKSKFTPRQFLKKYYGQDGMSLDHVDISDRPIYSFNDEMKRMYPLDSLSLIAEVKEKQRIAVENLTKRELEKSNNPTLVELDSLYKNQLMSGEKEIEYQEPFLRNPIVEEEYEERTRKFIEKTTPGPSKHSSLI